MKNRFVIYTAIFGKKDSLQEPRFIPPGFDFVCFTDQPFHSRTWQIRHADVSGDLTRNARKYKILAHQFLPEYEASIWIDGNILVKGDLSELLDKYLTNTNMAVLDHNALKAIPLPTLAAHTKRLLDQEASGKHQDDASLIQRQFEFYQSEGYPDTKGLACTLLMLRKHNEPDVVSAMTMWWEQLSKWSKRDQMSFNYVAWKTHLSFTYIPLDAFDNPYTKRLNHYLSAQQQLHSYVLGALKRLSRLFR